MAAARGIAAVVGDAELREDHIIPSPFNRDVPAAVADAVVEQAKRDGSARSPTPARSATRRATRRSSGRVRPGQRADDHRQRPAASARCIVAALTDRGDEVTVLTRSPGKAREKLRASRPSPGTRRRARPGRRARRPRRGRPPGRRGHRPALERRGAAPDPRVARAGHAQPRRRPARRRAAPARAHLRLRGRLLRQPARSPIDEDAPPGDDMLADVCVAWEREALEGGGARRPRRAHAHRPRARPPRRCAGEDAAAVPARRRRPGRRRRQPLPWIHLDDVVGMYLTRSTTIAGPARSTSPHRIPSPTASSRSALGRALHRPGVRARAGPRHPARCTAGWRSSWSRARTRSPAVRRSSATVFRHPDLDEALRSALDDT